MLLTMLLTAQATQSEVRISVQEDKRVITSNGIPNHPTGAFPNRNNPNRIAPQSYHFSVPLYPVIASRATYIGHRDFGIAINGVPFDPLTAEYYNRDRTSGWNYEAIMQGRGTLGVDTNNAHVQPDGAYHYHATPVGLLKVLHAEGQKMVQIGWAADGFPIYNAYGYTEAGNSKSPLKLLKPSYRVRSGERSSGPGGVYDGSFTADWEFVKGLGDLDECNGRFGVTPEFPSGTYYYVASFDYPYVPRYFKGTPDPSFNRGPQRRPPLGPGGFGAPPQEK